MAKDGKCWRASLRSPQVSVSSLLVMLLTLHGQLALFVSDAQDAIEFEVQVGDLFTHKGVELIKASTKLA